MYRISDLKKDKHIYICIYIGLSPLPVRVTTRIITFLVGNPYKSSFPLLLGGGTTQYIYICVFIYIYIYTSIIFNANYSIFFEPISLNERQPAGFLGDS